MARGKLINALDSGLTLSIADELIFFDLDAIHSIRIEKDNQLSDLIKLSDDTWTNSTNLNPQHEDSTAHKGKFINSEMAKKLGGLALNAFDNWIEDRNTLSLIRINGSAREWKSKLRFIQQFSLDDEKLGRSGAVRMAEVKYSGKQLKPISLSTGLRPSSKPRVIVVRN